MPEVLMPRLSDTMTEGAVSQWLKHEGERVERGDVLAEIETDKAVMELEAYDSGVLARILVQAGTSVPIGQPIAVIADPDALEPTTVTRPTPRVVESPPAAEQPEPAAAGSPGRSTPGAGTPVPFTSPLARTLARQYGLDISTIPGTGPGGRIVRADVEDARTAATSESPPATITAAAGSEAPIGASTASGTTDIQVDLSPIRRITAQRLTDSATAPHFYLTSVVDAEALLTLRAEINTPLVASTAGTKITVTDLLIRASALALRAHSRVNSSWGGDHLVQHAQINIGCAVALPDGLIVPVIRDADHKSISQIAAEAHALSDRARAGKLTPDEFSAGTFTVSNLGMFGIDHFTAIINPPEAAILAVGTARQEPVVRNGILAVGTTMKLTLTSDHRVLDGASAAAFLRDLVGLLEHPLRLVV